MILTSLATRPQKIMTKKNQGGFIQIPLLIVTIVGILVIGGAGYFGVTKYLEQQGSLMTAQQEIEKLKQGEIAKSAESEKRLNDLESQIQNTKSQQAQKITELNKSQAKEIANLKEIVSKSESTIDPAKISQKWGPYVVSVSCTFRYSDTGAVYEISNGSGTAMRFSGNENISIVTNKHVFLDNSGYATDFCSIAIPGVSGGALLVPSSDIKISNSFDYGMLEIKNSSAAQYNSIRQTLENLVSVFNPATTFCSEKPSSGDEVLILGYPAIGSKESVTATKGIISAFESNYSVTDAKIDHGNSGGAAILTKKNCFLGIPTAAKVGTIESLGRILDISVLSK